MIIFYLCVTAEAYMDNLWQSSGSRPLQTIRQKNIHENL